MSLLCKAPVNVQAVSMPRHQAGLTTQVNGHEATVPIGSVQAEGKIIFRPSMGRVHLSATPTMQQILGNANAFAMSLQHTKSRRHAKIPLFQIHWGKNRSFGQHAGVNTTRKH